MGVVVVYVSHESELVVMYVSYKCKPCGSSNIYLTQAFSFQ